MILIKESAYLFLEVYCNKVLPPFYYCPSSEPISSADVSPASSVPPVKQKSKYSTATFFCYRLYTSSTPAYLNRLPIEERVSESSGYYQLVPSPSRIPKTDITHSSFTASQQSSHTLIKDNHLVSAGNQILCPRFYGTTPEPTLVPLGVIL